jgi:predicted dehydrogenase
MKSAIVGTGTIAPVHLKAIIEAGGEIVALCDIECKKAEKLKKEFNLQSRIYPDYLEMLDHEEIDVVHVCTPHYLHAQMSIVALKRNINVLTEKPLCISLEELENIKEAQKSSKAILGICLQNRYLPANLLAYELLKEEKIVSVKGKVLWSRGEAYYRDAPWRGKWATSGGGAMINQAIHSLDLILWFCGMPVKIKGNIANNNLQDIIEVETKAEFKMFGTYTAEFFASNENSNNNPIELEIISNNYLIKIVGRDIYVNNCFQNLPNLGQLRGKDYWGAGHQSLIKDFYDSVLHQKPFSIGIEEAKKALIVIWALYKSMDKEIIIDKE